MQRLNRPTAIAVTFALVVGFGISRVLVPSHHRSPPSAQVDPRVWPARASGTAALAPLPELGAGNLAQTEPKALAPLADIEYFPQAVNSVSPASATGHQIATGNSLSDDQQQAWQNSLQHLEPKDALEIERLRTQLGSVAAMSLGLDQLQPQGVEPAPLQLPTDGKIQPAALVMIPQPSVHATVSDEGRSASEVSLRKRSPRDVANPLVPGFKPVIQRATITPGEMSVDPRLDLRQGALQITNNPFDIAVEGDGWFVVQRGDEAEKCVTRCGLLTRDRESRLAIQSSSGALPLVPTVTLPEKLQLLQITADGQCYGLVTDQPERVLLGRLQLGNCLNPSRLKPCEAGLYRPNADSGKIWQANPGERQLGRLCQGKLEDALP